MNEGNRSKEIVEQQNIIPSAGVGAAAMILGIISLITWCIPALGVLISLLAIILGIIGMLRHRGPKRSLAGFIMGIISLGIGILILVSIGGFANRSNVTQDTIAGKAWKRTDDGSVLYLYKDGTFIHTDQEGIFSDNFYRGTYTIVPYEDSGFTINKIDDKYDTDYIYDVNLYVDQRVSHGNESASGESSGKIQYLYMFNKKYSPGDIVQLCPHNDSLYADMTRVKETNLMFPSADNQYVVLDSAVEEIVSSEIPENETSDSSIEQMAESKTEMNTEEDMTTITEVDIETTEDENTENISEVADISTQETISTENDRFEGATEAESEAYTEEINTTETEDYTEESSILEAGTSEDALLQEDTTDVSLLDELEPGELTNLDELDVIDVDILDELEKVDTDNIWNQITVFLERIWDAFRDFFNNLSF